MIGEDDRRVSRAGRCVDSWTLGQYNPAIDFADRPGIGV